MRTTLALVLMSSACFADTRELGVTPQVFPPAAPPIVMPKRDYSGYTPWYEIVNGEKIPTSKQHLINTHHVDPKELEGLTQTELDQIHGREHNEKPKTVVKVAKPVYTPPAMNPQCPSGQCPLNRRRR